MALSRYPPEAASASEPLDIPPVNWVQYKDVIEDLYIKQNLPLGIVVIEMEKRYHFQASIPQYKRILNKWQFKKNKKASEWQAIEKSLKRRNLTSDNAIISDGGHYLSRKRVKRALDRHCRPSLFLTQAPSPSTPEGTLIRPVSPRPALFLNLKLPGLDLLSMFRAFESKPEFKALFQNTVTDHAELVATRQILGHDFGEKTALGLFPEQEPDLTAEHIGSAVARESLSLDIVMIGHVLYLCGNKLMEEQKLEAFTRYLLRKGDTDLYKLLSHVKSPHLRCFEEYLLLYAAKNNSYDIAKVLKLRGMNLSLPVQPFSPARTALQEAIINKNTAFCEKLLADGIDVDCGGDRWFVKWDDVFDDFQNHYHLVPIAMALRYSPGLVPALLARSNSVSKAEILILLLQSRTSIEVETVRSLLAQGVNIDGSDKWGQTALQLAIGSQNFEVAKFLIEEGAELNGHSSNGVEPLHEEAMEFDWDLRATILKRSLPPLSLAVLYNSRETLELLLQAGADPNICQCQRLSPGTRDFFEELINKGPEAGYDFDIGDYIDEYMDPVPMHLSALQIASSEGHTDMMQTLLDHGANIECCHGPTPLMLAAYGRNKEGLDLLLEYGASVAATFENQAICTDALTLGVQRHDIDIDIVRTLLHAKADPDGPRELGRYGKTPLQTACEEGNARTVELLLEHGANVNSPCAKECGKTCLQAAAYNRDIPMLHMLLSHGADVQGCPSHAFGHTAISALFSGGYPPYLKEGPTALRMLISAGADVAFNGWQGGGINSIPVIAAIFTAVWCDGSVCIDMIQTLISYGLDLRTDVLFDPDKDDVALTEPSWMEKEDRQQVFSLGELALIQAVYCSATAVLEFLLSLDFPISGYACVRAVSLLSCSVCWPEPILARFLSTAFMKGFEGIGIRSKFVLLSRSIERLFISACEEGITRISQLVIQLGILADQYMRGCPSVESGPLETACSTGRIEIVEQLITHGFNVNKSSRNGLRATALQAAAANGHVAIVEVLLSHGADVNAPAGVVIGNTALQAAVLAGHIDTIKLLLNHGANVNAPPKDLMGRTALQTAAEKGDLDTIKLLLSHGADVNASPSRVYGVTALQAAAIKGQMRIAQILIEAGAEEGGRTAINGAAERGRLDMVKLLLDFYKIKDGESISGICDKAIQYAKKECHWEVVKLLENYQREPGSSP